MIEEVVSRGIERGVREATGVSRPGNGFMVQIVKHLGIYVKRIAKYHKIPVILALVLGKHQISTLFTRNVKSA